MSDVRGKWPGKELVGMNFVGSAKAEREGEASGGETGGARMPGRRAAAPGGTRPGLAWGRRTPVGGRDPGAPAPPAAPPRPRRVARLQARA